MDTLEHRQDEIDPLDAEYAPGWTEQASDKIRGKLVEVGERDGGYGSYPIYTLELGPGYVAQTRDGEVGVGELVAVHAGRDVLRRKLENAGLEIGDEVGIKYQGPPKGAARSYRYRVIKFSPDGSYVDVPYEAGDGSPVDEAEAATQTALEAERDERDRAISAAQAVHELNRPLGGDDGE